MKQTCDICKGPIVATSIDVMISGTTFDETGDPVKTMEPISLNPYWDQDYVVVCSGCTEEVKDLWYEFLKGLDDVSGNMDKS